MRYEPRHRATPGTVRRLRRSMLWTTVATMALTTATGGTAALVLTVADTRDVSRFGASARTSSPTPSQDAWGDPVVVTSSRRTQDIHRVVGRAGDDRIDDIPDAALVAYQRAAAVMNEASPGNRLQWTLIAAVGRVLTDHGRRGGHGVDDRGNVRPAIVGRPVVARGGKRVGDTDAGLLDEDRRFDRPVGPMLLTPADWTVVGVDGDTDGKRNPQDLDDASLSLAVLLCAPGQDLRTTAGKRTALRRIHDTSDFVRAVLAADSSYRRQVRSGGAEVETVSLTTLPTLQTQPTVTPDRTAESRPPADTGSNPGVVPAGDDPPDGADPGHGPDPSIPPPAPEPMPTSTKVRATYDSEHLQISATAVVSAVRDTPAGGVTFALIGPGGVVVAVVPLAEGSATARFDVRDPGSYTVAVTYRGTRNHTGSKGAVVVEVAVPPSPEPSTEPSTEPAAG